MTGERGRWPDVAMRRPPTYILRIDVPLYIVDPPVAPGRAPEFDAVAEAVKIALALSRAAYVGVICNDAQVSLERSDVMSQGDARDS